MQPSLLTKVVEAQQEDAKAQAIRNIVSNGREIDGWILHPNRSLRYLGKVFVPKLCRKKVLHEFHHSRFVVHS